MPHIKNAISRTENALADARKRSSELLLDEERAWARGDKTAARTIRQQRMSIAAAAAKSAEDLDTAIGAPYIARLKSIATDLTEPLLRSIVWLPFSATPSERP